MRRVVTGLITLVLGAFCLGQGCVPTVSTGDQNNSNSGGSAQSGIGQPGGGQPQAQGQQPILSPVRPGAYHPSGTASGKAYVNGTLYTTTNQLLSPAPRFFGPHGLPLTTTDADIYNGYIQEALFAGFPCQFKVTAINATADTLSIIYDVTLSLTYNNVSYELHGPATDFYRVKPGGTLEEAFSGQIAFSTGDFRLSEDLLINATLSTTPPIAPTADQGGSLPVILPSQTPVSIAPTCGGQYTDAKYRFSLDLPDESAGPTFPSVAGSVVALEWTGLAGSLARIDIMITLSPTSDVATRIADLLKVEIADGNVEFESFFYTMISGVHAWYHRSYSTTSGWFGAEVIAIARGYWFEIHVTYPSNINDQQALSILSSLNSFCVEP